MNKKYIAWGTSKMLYIYKAYIDKIKFSYVIESEPKSGIFIDLPVKTPEALKSDLDYEVVIFAVANKTINLILNKLAETGREIGKGVSLYSDYFKENFEATLRNEVEWEASESLFNYSEAFTLNSLRPMHTTICGTWLFLEALKNTEKVNGDVAEVGAYQGGNALCSILSPAWKNDRNYYIFDSFEGFPDASANDPLSAKKGTYHVDISVHEIRNSFHSLNRAKIIKGFIPETFTQLPSDNRFSLVFYDCDLYQPALDTFAYFWDRLNPGGAILVHDYFAEPGGYEGVKKATDEFFSNTTAKIIAIPSSTMALIKKQS